MVTGTLKNKIDNLWTMFWTGGLTNPLDVIEQITYLMFIRDLDGLDDRRSKESVMLGVPYKSLFGPKNKKYKWSVFRDLPAPEMYNLVRDEVFPFIKQLHADKDSTYTKYMADAIFKIPTAQLFSRLVDTMDDMYAEVGSNQDIKGDLYEYLLSKLATSKTNGQFRTPRHIIRMMVDMLGPVPDDMICDPACGTSGFLVAAGEYLKEHYKKEIFHSKKKKDHYNNDMFFGYDMDRTMLRIAAMNLMTHGIDNPNIEYRDSLSDQNRDAEKFTKILANPPFTGSLDYDAVSTDLVKMVKTKKTQLLFLALFIRMLKVGGRCAVIVPDGVLFGSDKATAGLRKEIIENHRLEAIVSMPAGIFKPYTPTSTGIIVFTKTGHGGTDKVWFYDMQSDGFSLDDKRMETGDSDIPDIVKRFSELDKEKRRKRTDRSFFVPKEEIVTNAYDLSINKYKQTDHVAEEYPPTAEILKEISDLEKQIAAGLKKLEGLV